MLPCVIHHCPSHFAPQASHLDPKLLLPRLGLAQANVLMGEHTNAASLLESALVEAPYWGDALEVGGRGSIDSVKG